MISFEPQKCSKAEYHCHRESDDISSWVADVILFGEESFIVLVGFMTRQIYTTPKTFRVDEITKFHVIL
jgi:hypothetical protein